MYTTEVCTGTSFTLQEPHSDGPQARTIRLLYVSPPPTPSCQARTHMKTHKTPAAGIRLPGRSPHFTEPTGPVGQPPPLSFALSHTAAISAPSGDATHIGSSSTNDSLLPHGHNPRTHNIPSVTLCIHLETSLTRPAPKRRPLLCSFILVSARAPSPCSFAALAELRM